MNGPLRATPRYRASAGFSGLEMLIVLLTVSALSAMVVMLVPRVVRAMKGESVAQQLNAFLREAREEAIARRRLVRVVHVPPNAVQSLEVNPIGGGTTLIRAMRLEGAMEFHRYAEQGDTGDRYGPADEDVVGFSGTEPHAFSTEGAFVDAAGDPANGTLFIAEQHKPDTAAAVTVYGPTGTFTVWHWNGRDWSK